MARRVTLHRQLVGVHPSRDRPGIGSGPWAGLAYTGPGRFGNKKPQLSLAVETAAELG